MTAFAELSRLAAEARICLLSAADAEDPDVKAQFADSAREYLAAANDLLKQREVKVTPRVANGSGLVTSVDDAGRFVINLGGGASVTLSPHEVKEATQ